MQSLFWCDVGCYWLPKRKINLLCVSPLSVPEAGRTSRWGRGFQGEASGVLLWLLLLVRGPRRPSLRLAGGGKDGSTTSVLAQSRCFLVWTSRCFESFSDMRFVSWRLFTWSQLEVVCCYHWWTALHKHISVSCFLLSCGWRQLQSNPGFGHKLTLDQHDLLTKKQARTRRRSRTQTTTRRSCVACCVFLTQMATQGIWNQLHLLPRSLFASDMARLAHVSCPDFD